MQNNNPLIRTQGITKSFTRSEGGELLVLDAIDFQLNAGEIVCYIG